MITEIGIVAGEIWQFLEKRKEASLEDIFKSLDKSKEIILMSLGWLAREGHVLVRKTKDSLKFALRERKE